MCGKKKRKEINTHWHPLIWMLTSTESEAT